MEKIPNGRVRQRGVPRVKDVFPGAPDPGVYLSAVPGRGRSGRPCRAVRLSPRIVVPSSSGSNGPCSVASARGSLGRGRRRPGSRLPPRSRGRRLGTFRGPAVSTNLLHDSEELDRRDAGHETSGSAVHVIRSHGHCRAPQAGRRPMLKREGIGICTLCAPYASRRHGRRTWLALVSVCKIRRKAGAGERTRTADLLITNCYTPRVVPLRARAWPVRNLLI